MATAKKTDSENAPETEIQDPTASDVEVDISADESGVVDAPVDVPVPAASVLKYDYETGATEV